MSKSEEDVDSIVDDIDQRNRKEDSSFSGIITKWGRTLGILLAVVITPAVTLFNTIKVGDLNREVELVTYFQKEIKESLDQLAGSDSEKSRVALASLYSLANNYDKKRVLVSIASSRGSDDLDEAISYLILSEDDKERKRIIVNNPSLRESSRRIEAKWVETNYGALEGVESNADIRPQVTNGGTQLLSLFSSNALEGWILLGRLPDEASKEINEEGKSNLSIQKEIAKGFNLNSEGAIIRQYNIGELEQSSVDIVSPIYIRQSPPRNEYDLTVLAASSSTSIIGVLCQGSKVRILDFKPVKPAQGNYTLWGKVIVTESKPCYSPADGKAIDQK
jgi:hypothetical protein